MAGGGGGQDRKASREKETVLLDKNLISSLNVFNIGPTRPDPVPFGQGVAFDYFYSSTRLSSSVSI